MPWILIIGIADRSLFLPILSFFSVHSLQSTWRSSQLFAVRSLYLTTFQYIYSAHKTQKIISISTNILFLSFDASTKMKSMTKNVFDVLNTWVLYTNQKWFIKFLCHFFRVCLVVSLPYFCRFLFYSRSCHMPTLVFWNTYSFLQYDSQNNFCMPWKMNKQ